MPHPAPTDGVEIQGSFQFSFSILAHGHIQQRDISPRPGQGPKRQRKTKQVIGAVAVATWSGFVVFEEAALVFHLGPTAVILALGGIIATPAAWVAGCALQGKRSGRRGNN